MSIGCHQKTRLSRKDDLLSLGYVLIYLYVGNLPWQGLDISDRKEKDSAVSEIKQYYGYSKLCKTLPKFFSNYFSELEKLSQTDKPDYEKLKYFFKKELNTESFSQNIDYDWSVNE